MGFDKLNEQTGVLMDIEELYQQMLLIRRFEERLFELFSAGELSGTIHTYLGQEAIAVGVLNHLRGNDMVVSNHRCHGHYLARTGDVVGLLGEIMGKDGGVSGGWGGSQHIHKGNFFSNGVQGNMFPVAAGMAYAEKSKGSGAIMVIFVGDGTFGQGTVYETLNLVSLWSVPILIIVENNRYAQSTPVGLTFSGSFVERVKGFEISVGEIESNDAEELYQRFGPIIEKVRSEQLPHVEIIDTYRLGPHSKGDDVRPKEEIDKWRKKDPLLILKRRMSNSQIKKIEEKVLDLIVRAEKEVRQMPYPILMNNI
jgi:acetoin:2,6-dichlorophenolindophenol oxidoreductase subunit alpha